MRSPDDLPNITAADLAETLREYRERSGLKQKTVAFIAGTRPNYVGVLERGLQGNPKFKLLAGMAKAFEVPLSQVIRDAEFRADVREGKVAGR